MHDYLCSSQIRYHPTRRYDTIQPVYVECLVFSSALNYLSCLTNFFSRYVATEGKVRATSPPRYKNRIVTTTCIIISVVWYQQQQDNLCCEYDQIAGTLLELTMSLALFPMSQTASTCMRQECLAWWQLVAAATDIMTRRAAVAPCKSFFGVHKLLRFVSLVNERLFLLSASLSSVK